MSNITMSRQFRKRLDIDGSLKQRAWDFLTKLMTDPTSPGLHIEPIKGSRDPRVRTGRVNDNFRAVMFLVAQQPEPHFVLAAVAKHDEANALAERLVLTTNPVTGVLEVLEDTPAHWVPPAPPVSAATPVEASAAADSMSGASVAAEVAPSAEPPLAGFASADLEAIGLPASLVARALACADEDALIAVAGDERLPSWQGDALLTLATGASVADVLAQLRPSDAPPADNTTAASGGPTEPGGGRATEPGGEPELAPGSKAEPEQVLTPASDAEVEAALARPGTLMDFVRIETDGELRRVLDGTFADWRVFLHPEQRHYVHLDTNGAYRLTGGAGTGKTVVALHRARHLTFHKNDARVVLTTFTRNLADNLARDLRILDPSIPQVRLGQPGITVRGIDQLALEIVGSTPAEIRAKVGGDLLAAGTVPGPLTDREERAAWADAARARGLTGDLARPSFLISEYRMVILARDLTTRADYLRAPRPGRGTRLSRAQRMSIWDAVEKYRRQLALDQKASFAEIAVLAARCADATEAADGRRPADYVVVDEAQDLHPGHWRLLRALVAEGPNDLFIAEDSHQRIYGEKVVLSRYGIHIRGRSRRLTLNYRTTAQNLRFAVSILADSPVTDLDDETDSVAGYRSAMNGPAPALHPCSGLTEELDAAADTLRAWLIPPAKTADDGARGAKRDGKVLAVEPGSLGILTRSAAQRDTVAQGLRDRGIPVQVVATQDPGRADAPRLMTMHRAKGLEFSRVILFGVDRNAVPSAQALADETPDERADRETRERFLLYVAASRARDALVVLWTGSPSPFLPR
ncbi:UvrD-helicase domain-containing protein [Pseudofrankia sp. BMG5.37]|uniref:UvrD-helicase domain-containing protein n=1 Tax=Pseudofrankia sp. BMG5.37 TaxID=3050035 RepID=UPI0028951893|nr:UvrD-helicase domain-containing protein [Pseudofrankia sp. BMG5.37]MDT3443579.1 3'-5' exonuclease [Pseudofrankia sp. BMG5.37]